MSLISAAALAKARAQVESTLTDTITVQRVTRTADGKGGWTEAWTTREATTGRIDPLARVVQIAEAGKAEALRVEWQITLRWDANIQVGDRLLINGTAYEIRQAQFEHSSLVCKRCGVAVVK